MRGKGVEPHGCGFLGFTLLLEIDGTVRGVMRGLILVVFLLRFYLISEFEINIIVQFSNI